MSEMCQELTKILYDRPFSLPKIPLSDTIGRIIIEKNIETAISEYHDLKENHAEKYEFNENALNTLGYQLLRIGLVEDAIKVFKLNITEYPDAFNPYDSLGEAYMIQGNGELAIKYYTKSLELNPQNINAINMLQRIQERMD